VLFVAVWKLNQVKASMKRLKFLQFSTRAEWRVWLEEHHTKEREAWLLHYKKGAGKNSLTYEEAVEEALCFGWIDGLLQSLDAEKFALRYSPRKGKSIWSEINKQRAERLIREGRMTQAGLAKIAQAKENGEWEAATKREEVNAIPADLERALQSHKTALATFKQWPASRKKQYLWWLASAKRAETREKRIQAILDMILQ
jgi:uncharacterized protein YdeI (YjbR/CyaY-like superfamily)